MLILVFVINYNCDNFVSKIKCDRQLFGIDNCNYIFKTTLPMMS